MRNIHKLKLILFLLILNNFTFPQVVFEDINSEVYKLLNHLSLKKIISFNDETLPLSRNSIAALLLDASHKREQLNRIEKEEVEWYLEEYAYEVNSINNNSDIHQRWYALDYSDSLFMVRGYPVAGYGVSAFGEYDGHTKLIGAGFYGTYSNWFSASFEYKDMGEFGDNVDRKKDLTRRTGYFINSRHNSGIEFSDVRGSISLNWDWGFVSVRKDYNLWGHGRFGQLFISNKSASYPQVLLSFKPVDWFRFNYFHGWINSLIPDSNSFYYNHLESEKPFLRRKYVDKYIVANMLTISPWEWLDFSAGNSYVYSGSLRPEMFIPFMYYKVMDHNTGREGWGDGNGQIFFDVKVNYWDNLSIYSSLLIDVLEIRQILKGNWYTSWFGYSIGGQYADVIIPNLDITLEYTKTNPWLYENNDESTTYKHLGYSLGHWIGQNADLLSVNLDYRIIRGLKVSLLYERFRKGGMNDIINAYQNRTNLPFLYGSLRVEKTVGLGIRYEPLYDLLAEAKVFYSDISDEDIQRTPLWQIGYKYSIDLSLSYGL
ncbi:MAG: capsule assembly Wzi family protein [Ignavibacteriaceae bacterium]